MPCVSVVIPCHHSQKDIRLALSSLAQQRFRDFEILLMSDDEFDYRPLAADFAAQMPIAFGSTGGKSTGRSNANNIAMTMCKGEAVLILDSDDFLAPDFLERTVPRTLAEGACLTPRRPIDYDDFSPVHTRGLLRLPAYEDKTRLSTEDYIHLPFGWQTMYRRDLLIYPWETRYWLDPDFILECSLFDRIGYAPFEFYQGYNYRIRAGSICHSKDSYELVLKEYRDMAERLGDDKDGLRLKPSTRTAMRHMLEGRIQSVQRYLRERDSGTLLYEPLVIGDMLMYPL